MRLYRAKRKDNGEWVYGSLTICNAYDLKDGTHPPEPLHAIICKQDIEWISEPDNKRWCFPSYEVHPETVGQQIGLKDEHGKEIYAGDRIKHIWEYAGQVQSEVIDVKWKEDWSGFSLPLSVANNSEIIGNIHTENQNGKGG